MMNRPRKDDLELFWTGIIILVDYIILLEICISNYHIENDRGYVLQEKNQQRLIIFAIYYNYIIVSSQSLMALAVFAHFVPSMTSCGESTKVGFTPK